MNRNSLSQPGTALTILFAAGTLALPPAMLAQPAKLVETLTATTVGLSPGAGETLNIELLRWSTDAELEKAVAAFRAKGETELSTVLRAAPSVGYIWVGSESLGYSVRYAQRLTMPDGGARILLATDRPLGSWSRDAWKAVGPSATDLPFTVIELRLRRAGVGEGKASLAAKVAIVDEHLALENYASAPVLLKNVKRVTEDPGPTATPTTDRGTKPAPTAATPAAGNEGKRARPR